MPTTQKDSATLIIKRYTTLNVAEITLVQSPDVILCTQLAGIVGVITRHGKQIMTPCKFKLLQERLRQMMRTLNEGEQKWVKLIQGYEKALAEHKLTFPVTVGPGAIDTMRKGIEAGHYNALRIDPSKDGKTIEVTFRTPEFEKYLHWVMSQAGMALLSDYKLIFSDGHAVVL